MGASTDWVDLVHIGKSPSGKTDVYAVVNVGGTNLGEVRWRGQWRGYAFYPDPDTLYEQHCMRTIADWLEDLTRAHREGRKAYSDEGS